MTELSTGSRPLPICISSGQSSHQKSPLNRRGLSLFPLSHVMGMPELDLIRVSFRKTVRSGVSRACDPRQESRTQATAARACSFVRIGSSPSPPHRRLRSFPQTHQSLSGARPHPGARLIPASTETALARAHRPAQHGKPNQAEAEHCPPGRFRHRKCVGALIYRERISTRIVVVAAGSTAVAAGIGNAEIERCRACRHIEGLRRSGASPVNPSPMKKT